MKGMINNRQCRHGVIGSNKEVGGEVMLKLNALLWYQFETKWSFILENGLLSTQIKAAFDLHVLIIYHRHSKDNTSC